MMPRNLVSMTSFKAVLPILIMIPVFFNDSFSFWAIVIFYF